MMARWLVISAFSLAVVVGFWFDFVKVIQKIRSKFASICYGSSSSNPITPHNMEQDMLQLVLDKSNVSLDQFPYYLSEQTKLLLKSAAYVHLKNSNNNNNNVEISKYVRNLAPASRTILLTGPTELYQQLLVKALAHHSEAKFLILDLNDFSVKIKVRYDSANKESSPTRSNSGSIWERLSDLYGLLFSNKVWPNGKTLMQSRAVDLHVVGTQKSFTPPGNAPVSHTKSLVVQFNTSNSGVMRNTTSWSLDEKLLIETLYKVLVSVSETSPIVLYLRDVDKLFCRSDKMCDLFQNMLSKLSGPILILGSRVLGSTLSYPKVDDVLDSLFSYNIELRSPEDETDLVKWKAQFEEDMKIIKAQDNRNNVMKVLAANDLDCGDLESISVEDLTALSNSIEEIAVGAISHHLMNNKDPEYKNGKLVIPSNSLSHALEIFRKGKFGATPKPVAQVVKSENSHKRREEGGNSSKKADGAKLVAAPQDVSSCDEFEEDIRASLIPAKEIDVTFSDIGALEETKESLEELIMLPLRRPDLFIDGGLIRPCKGILLFGPPGTGKTMLAKAIAKEAGSSFINLRMSSIATKWFGESEKYVHAVFTLAAKVSPTVIFIDEVDSMLGKRGSESESKCMRPVKNEFLSHWDGLLSKAEERILVLGATNRPFDLDDAVIRRFERRIMIGLPSFANREKILRTILAKEKLHKDVNLKELAAVTEGYSGSDLKNLCVIAAYRPVRELLKQERLQKLEKKQNGTQDSTAPSSEDGDEEKKEKIVIARRPLNMQDLRVAKNQVGASYVENGAEMHLMKGWNDLYGDGGSRDMEQLFYYL